MAGLILPEPEALARRSEISKHETRENVDLKREYQGLQVIVKLANIVLTPENPSYEGGTWHVEGQKVRACSPRRFSCRDYSVTKRMAANSQGV